MSREISNGGNYDDNNEHKYMVEEEEIEIEEEEEEEEVFFFLTQKNEPLNVYSTFHNPHDSWSSATFRFILMATAWTTTPWAVYAKLDTINASPSCIAISTTLSGLIIVLLPTIFNVDNDKEYNGPISISSSVRIGIELFLMICVTIAPWFIPECNSTGMKTIIIILVLLTLISGAERWYYLDDVRNGTYFRSFGISSVLDFGAATASGAGAGAGAGGSDTDSIISMGPIKQVESALSLLLTGPEDMDDPLGIYSNPISERVPSYAAITV